MSYRNVFGASVFALGMAVAAPAAMAQADAPAMQPPAAESGATAQSFPDEKLESFAAANVKVEMLNQEYESKVQAAAEPAAQEAVATEKNEKLAEAVTSEGLTVEEYNQIYMASKNDQTLQSKIEGMKTMGDQQSSLP
jgi:hypothetical protein